jgi:hypothetical protein
MSLGLRGKLVSEASETTRQGGQGGCPDHGSESGMPLARETSESRARNTCMKFTTSSGTVRMFLNN